MGFRATLKLSRFDHAPSFCWAAGQNKVATLWLGLALWLFMALGEARLLSQARMAMLAWAALFSLPTAYRQSRRMLDSVAEEILDFAVGVLAGGQCHVLARPK